MSIKVVNTERVGKENPAIISFLLNNVEPLHDAYFGSSYRASAYLNDGTFIPCVSFCNSKKSMALAISQLKEAQPACSTIENTSDSYYDIIRSFLVRGNLVNDYDIASVEISQFAFPYSLLKQIEAGTRMGWTGFAAKMKDGKYYGFGTGYAMGFFQMPENYTVSDIEQIINHSYVTKAGELYSFANLGNYDDEVIYKGRPYFVCYLDSL